MVTDNRLWRTRADQRCQKPVTVWTHAPPLSLRGQVMGVRASFGDPAPPGWGNRAAAEPGTQTDQAQERPSRNLSDLPLP